MLRLNRGRVIGLLLTSFIVYFLFLSSSNSSPSDFRKRTEEGLSRRHGVLQGDISDEAYRAQTNARLNDILYSKKQQEAPLGKPPPPQPKAEAPKKKLNDDDDDYDNSEKEKETSVAGRKTMPAKDADKPKYPKQQVMKDKEKETKKVDKEDEDEDTPAKKKTKTSSDPGKDTAREKLQEYLKKPIVIFSKSYCPHSKRAKHLLLDIYKITPTPLVVELDQLTEKLPLPPRHKKSAGGGDDDDTEEEEQSAEDDRPAPTLGAKIQEILYEITERRTVPNIMVGGTTSIGGNDLLWEMHEEGTLKGKIMELGGKRIVSVEQEDAS